MNIKMKYVFSALAVILLITACSNTGIFYGLSNEEKIQESNNLNNNISFSTMVQAGTYYLGAAGPGIYYRSTSSSSTDKTVDDWKSLALPSGFSDDATVPSMVLQNNGDLIISRISYDGSTVKSGIYRLSGAAAAIGAGTITWSTLVETTAVKGTSDVSYYRLYGDSNDTTNRLFINELTYQYGSTSDDSAVLSDSKLYTTVSAASIANDLAGNTTTIDISSFVKDNDDADMAAPVQKIIYTSINPHYWMIINGESIGKIFSSDNGTFSGDLTEESSNISSSSLDDTLFVDIYVADASHILISNTDGSLYILSGPGGTFTELTRGSNLLNGFVDISSIKANTILVGTATSVASSTVDGSGYYELNTSSWDWNDTDQNFSDLNNYKSSDLYDSTINGFLYDSGNDRLFAYTRGAGVWMNELDGSTRFWTRE